LILSLIRTYGLVATAIRSLSLILSVPSFQFFQLPSCLLLYLLDSAILAVTAFGMAECTGRVKPITLVGIVEDMTISLGIAGGRHLEVLEDQSLTG
jgi:hypothetical protein